MALDCSSRSFLTSKMRSIRPPFADELEAQGVDLPDASAVANEGQVVADFTVPSFGGLQPHAWFRTSVTIPAEFSGQRVGSCSICLKPPVRQREAVLRTRREHHEVLLAEKARPAKCSISRSSVTGGRTKTSRISNALPRRDLPTARSSRCLVDAARPREDVRARNPGIQGRPRAHPTHPQLPASISSPRARGISERIDAP